MPDVDIERLFIQDFTTAGCTQFDCDCGKSHYALESYYDWDDQEEGERMRSQLIADAEEDENIDIHYYDDTLEIIELDGRSWVADCDCKGWKPYMNFIFKHRRRITYFLSCYATDLKDQLEKEELIRILEGKVEELGSEF